MIRRLQNALRRKRTLIVAGFLVATLFSLQIFTGLSGAALTKLGIPLCVWQFAAIFIGIAMIPAPRKAAAS